MNHLDYNYAKHYINQSFEVANSIPPESEQAKFLCSVWNGLYKRWEDVWYQISPVAQFIFIASINTNDIHTIKMDRLDKLPIELRNRLVTEFCKITGSVLPVSQKYPTELTEIQDKSKPMTATAISTKELADKYNQITLANLKATVHNLKKLEEESMYATMDDSFLKKYCDTLGKQQGPLKPKELEPSSIKIIPIFHTPNPKVPPLKSNTSIYWKLEEYKPFDIFTILNNLTKDYAYN